MRRGGELAGHSFTQEFAVFADFLAVDFDVTPLPEVADHIPVEAGLVGVSGFGVAGAEGEVDGAADFFVEEGVFGEAGDGVVGADGAFAEEAGAGVHVEHGEEEFLVFGGGGIRHFAVFENESDALHFAGVVDGGEGEADGSVDGVEDGAGEDFAIREIFVAVAVDPGVAGDGHADVGAIGSDDVVIGFAVEQVGELLLADGDALPGGDGVGLVEEAGVEDEILVLGEGHLGILGAGLAGELGADPVGLAFGGALEEGLGEGAIGGGGAGDAFGVDIGQGPGVGGTPEADVAVDSFDLVFGDGVEEIELGIGGIFEKDFAELVEGEADEGVAAGGDDLTTDLDHQRLRDDGAGDADKLAGFDGDGVVDQDLGELGEAGVGHGGIVGGKFEI